LHKNIILTTSTTVAARLPLLLAMAMLAGCIIETPHPFQPAKPLPNEVPRAENAPSIVAVRPVAGMGEPLASDFASAMAMALQIKSLPAVVASDDQAIYTVGARLGRNEAGEPAILWNLEDEQGRVIARAAQQLPASGEPALPANRAAIIAAIAEDPATVISEGIEGDAPTQLRPLASKPPAQAAGTLLLPPARTASSASTTDSSAPATKSSAEAKAAARKARSAKAAPAAAQSGTNSAKIVKEAAAETPAETPAAATTPPGHRVMVTVPPTKGLPDQGDATLRHAILYALQVAKVDATEDRVPGSMDLVGKVDMTDLGGDLRHVKVTWSLRRPDGTEIGQVSQENNVRAGVIERAWGEIAAAVSENAAGDIASLVNETLAKTP
jgi:hypothetical protein